MQRPIYGHSGDAGDALACLAVIRAMDGGDMIFFDRDGASRRSMKGERFEALKPLIEAQPYIGRCSWSDAIPQLDHDFSTFRHDHKPGEDLLSWQARHVEVKPCFDPWLMCRRSEKSIGRVVVARSNRYQNLEFPWRRLVATHRKKLLFVGLPDEHQSFQIANGCMVEYCPTRNLLELAEIINGCELFIGNQSCPFWIAAGLGVNLIQESFRAALNSIIKRPNAQYLIHPPYNV